jgi:hypothetical protein
VIEICCNHLRPKIVSLDSITLLSDKVGFRHWQAAALSKLPRKTEEDFLCVN